jgi:cardiolipin synthase
VTPSASRWRHLPNGISLARLASTPVLLVLVLERQRGAFTWLLLAALLSDIVDGLAARAFDFGSDLGSRLDSIADVLVTLIGLGGVLILEPAFVRAHAPALLGVVALYLLEVGAALLRYGRISSFHTFLSRVAAHAQGIFILSLLLFGYHATVFYLMIVLSAIAITEELLLLGVLPEWRTNVGGLYRVLRYPPEAGP